MQLIRAGLPLSLSLVLTGVANAGPPPPPPAPPERGAEEVDERRVPEEVAQALARKRAAVKRAREEAERARARAREHAGKRPRAPRPPRVRPPPPPRVSPWNGPQVIVLHPDHPYEHPSAGAPPPPPSPPEAPPDRPARPPEDRGAAGGIALSAGATNFFGLVPLRGDLMAGARLSLALAAPSESSRWLSNAAFGITGGVDTGQHRGIDAQVFHAGAVFALGAPWSRDVLGVSVEGGLLGSRSYDGNAGVLRQSSTTLYGLGRLVLQAPLKGDVRPFIAGEFGVTERRDDKLSAIAGLTGGVVWNAW